MPKILTVDTTATVVIDHINYDVKGRREEVEYGAGTTTTYASGDLATPMAWMTPRGPLRSPS